jgi:ssDNA thymidine ADP-ribosyltransferase DarT-like protein
MNARVTEFHCIMPLENIPSVLKLGILSNERAAKLEHRSVAMEDVQEKREMKHVPGGLKLHQYANLYFHARNPMLYKRKGEVNNLCVLRISTEILQLPGVVLADCNASSPYVRFLAPSQWELLDYEAIYAMDWNRQHANDPYAYRVHKARKCAEVLVPHVVETKFVIGAYVVDEAAKLKLQSLGFVQVVTIDSEMFFR